MERRQYLWLTAGVLSGLAGCGTGSPSSPEPESSPSRTPNNPVPADDGSDTESSPTRSPEKTGIAVDIETTRYLVRSFAQTQDQRAIDPEQITPAVEISNPLRTALEAAVDGGYETDDVSDELLSGIDRFRHNGGGYRFEPYFSLDGTPYAFDPTVPVFVAHLEMGIENPDPDRTVGPDDLEGLAEPVRDFVRTIGAFTVQVPRDEYRISVVPDTVEDFLENYDYVRDPDGVGRIVTERVDPGPPYTIEASKLTTQDLWGRPVLAATSLPTDLRRFVEAVVASDRRALVYPPLRSEYRTDQIPDAYFDRLGPDQGPGSGPYVDLDGTFYAFRVTEIRREKIPIAISTAVVDERSFEVTITPSQEGSKPAIEGPVELESAGALPSVLWIETTSNRYLLDSDAYDDISWSDPEGSTDEQRRIDNVERTEVPPGEALSATYRVPDAVPAGTYRAWGLVRVQWTRASDNRRFPTLAYPYQIVVTIPETG